MKPQPIAKVLQTHSERVKAVDLHPKEPLVLCSLYTGQVTLWNFETQTLMKAFDIVENRDPVRCAKFIPRLQSFVCGSDDLMIRVFNYNTMEKMKTFEAHSDYIRSMAVHDSLPYLLTASDDMTVRMWDWSKGWQCAMIFEGHTHYVMNVVFNPKDSATFATASLDTYIMVWSVTSNQRNFTLEGHEQGVNCVEYFGGGDKPYLCSGSDDRTVRIWDYQTKACLQVLSYHEKNVTCLNFHPTLPLLFAGSEDETVSVFSTQTWRLDQCMNFALERVWNIACKKNTGHVAIGFDHGMVVLRVGSEEPVHSMDAQGKILVSSNTEILRMDVKMAQEKEVADGEVIQLPSKELGSMESPPTKILHSPNGQYAAVLFGDDEYTVNSTLAWRPKCFGKAVAFAWGPEAGTFAILENSQTLKVFKQFKAKDSIKLPGTADMLFSGTLLGLRIDDALIFLDWEGLNVIRRILERPKAVQWSDSGELVAVLTDDTAFVLKCNIAHVMEYVAKGANRPDGTDESFDLVEELESKIRQAVWVGDCLVFCDSNERLNFYIGGEIDTLGVLPRSYFILGYANRDNRIYCMDRERNVISFFLHGSQVEYLTAIVREDFEGAAALLPKVPESARYKIARLLQTRELPHIAITVTTDEDHKFELAVILKRLDTLQELIEKAPSQTKWRQLGDIALQLGQFEIAEAALWKSSDFNGLLLLHTCTANREGLKTVAFEAFKKRRYNVAFTAFHTLADHSKACDALIASSMFSEAAFYARTYCHGRIMEAVSKWKASLGTQPKLREAIADPLAYPNLFPGVELEPAAANEAVEEEEEDGGNGSPVVAVPKHQADDEEAMVAAAAAAAAVTPPKLAAAASMTSPPPAAAAQQKQYQDPAPKQQQQQEEDADDLWNDVAASKATDQKSPSQPKAAAAAAAAAANDDDDLFSD